MKRVGDERIASLDGLRAVSIGLVILDHATMGSRVNAGRVAAVLAQGGFGVTVFFVISGFLITGLLLREFDRTGGIMLRRFYLRRTLRIFPAYYAYIAAIATATALGRLHVSAANIISALTYSSNYCFGCKPRDGWYLAHTWSLSVEEQFYLLWPLLLALAGRRRGGWIVLVWLLVPPLLRVHQIDETGMYEWRTHFEVVSDAIATGCVLAIYLPRLHASPSYIRIRDFLGVWSAVAAFALATLAFFPSLIPPRTYVLACPTIENIAIALFLDRVVSHPLSAVGRVLNHPRVVWLGGLSYSLYLWQQPFIRGDPLPLPYSLGLILMVSSLSSYLVERPILRLRETIERRVLPPVPETRAGSVSSIET